MVSHLWSGHFELLKCNLTPSFPWLLILYNPHWLLPYGSSINSWRIFFNSVFLPVLDISASNNLKVNDGFMGKCLISDRNGGGWLGRLSGVFNNDWLLLLLGLLAAWRLLFGDSMLLPLTMSAECTVTPSWIKCTILWREVSSIIKLITQIRFSWIDLLRRAV